MRLASDHLARKTVESIIFKTLSRRTFKLMQSRGIRTTDGLFGLHQTGHMSEEYVIGLIRSLPLGTTEIYFHPAEDPDTTSGPTPGRVEVQILKSSRVREALIRSGTRLTSFREIANGQKSEAAP
jgi:chitin disaccharide deacetylase